MANMKGAILDGITKMMQQRVSEQQSSKWLSLVINSSIEGDGEYIDMRDFEVPLDEIRIVDQFLSKFVIMPESGLKDQIDIKLMINALPNRIMSYSLETVEMFNFRIFQESLHAY